MDKELEDFLARVEQVNSQIKNIIESDDISVANIEFPSLHTTTSTTDEKAEEKIEEKKSEENPKAKRKDALDYSYFDTIKEEADPDDISYLPMQTQQQLKDIERDINQRKSDRLNEAKLSKTDGNSFFSKKQYTEAMNCYNKGIKLLEGVVKQENQSSERDILVQLYTNNAICCLKLTEKDICHADTAVDVCDKAIALDKHNLKAYLRRSQAKEFLQKYEESLSDLQVAKRIAKKANDNATTKQIEASIRRCSKIFEEQKRLQNVEPLGPAQDRLESISVQYRSAGIDEKEALCNEIFSITSKEADSSRVALYLKTSGLLELLISDLYVKFDSEPALRKSILSVLTSLSEDSDVCARSLLTHENIFKRIIEYPGDWSQMLTYCTSDEAFTERLYKSWESITYELIISPLRTASSQSNLEATLTLVKNILSNHQKWAEKLGEDERFDLIVSAIINHSKSKPVATSLQEVFIDVLLAMTANDVMREKLSSPKYGNIFCNSLINLVSSQLIYSYNLEHDQKAKYEIESVSKGSLYIIEGVLSIISNLTIRNNFSDDIMKLLCSSGQLVRLVIAIVGTEQKILQENLTIRYKAINILSRLCVFTSSDRENGVAQKLVHQREIITKLMNDTKSQNYAQIDRPTQKYIEAAVRCLTACCTVDSSFVSLDAAQQLFIPLLDCPDPLVAGNACMTLSYVAAQSEKMSELLGISCGCIPKFASILSRSDTDPTAIRLQKNAAIALSSLARHSPKCKQILSEKGIMTLIRNKAPSVL